MTLTSSLYGWFTTAWTVLKGCSTRRLENLGLRGVLICPIICPGDTVWFHLVGGEDFFSRFLFKCTFQRKASLLLDTSWNSVSNSVASPQLRWRHCLPVELTGWVRHAHDILFCLSPLCPLALTLIPPPLPPCPWVLCVCGWHRCCSSVTERPSDTQHLDWLQASCSGAHRPRGQTYGCHSVKWTQCQPNL